MTIIPAFTHFRAEVTGWVTLVAGDVSPGAASGHLAHRAYCVLCRLSW